MDVKMIAVNEIKPYEKNTKKHLVADKNNVVVIALCDTPFLYLSRTKWFVNRKESMTEVS